MPGRGYGRGVRARERRALEAISTYVANVGATLDLRAIAATVGNATGAAGCAVHIAGESYVWGNGSESWVEHQVTYGGELQGVLALAPESVGKVPAVAAVLGAPFAVLRLATETDRLRRAGDALARQFIDDRWRATTEMEEERRTLERDLHDGVQHHLVALQLALGLVEESRDAIRERLPDLLTRLDTAERVLADTAAGVLPLALASDGLAVGLAAELANADVTLDVTGLRRRRAPEIEAAVYFSCLEAVNNAHKHAPGASVTVTVRDRPHGIEFAVTDTGPGFTESAKASGLHNLTARIEAVGGVIEIYSASTGTTILGRVPCPG